MSQSTPETTAPWAGNRNGDPRQLIHEAKSLESSARVCRQKAAMLRRDADEQDAAAKQMEDAALDYRRWAMGREAESDA